MEQGPRLAALRRVQVFSGVLPRRQRRGRSGQLVVWWTLGSETVSEVYRPCLDVDLAQSLLEPWFEEGLSFSDSSVSSLVGRSPDSRSVLHPVQSYLVIWYVGIAVSVIEDFVAPRCCQQLDRSQLPDVRAVGTLGELGLSATKCFLQFFRKLLSRSKAGPSK